MQGAQAYAAWPLRVAVATVFLVHGVEMLLDLAQWQRDFALIGIPLPGLAAPTVAIVEVLGAVAIFLGVLDRVASWTLAFVMLVALLTARLPYEGFAGFTDGWSLDWLLLGALVTLGLMGSGRPTLRSALQRRPSPA